MIRIEVHQKRAKLEKVERLVKEVIKKEYPEATVSVTRQEPASSRADQFDEAVSYASDAHSTAEGLRDELQDWFDNLPEAFQQGDKGSELEEAISSLDEFIEACDNAENVSVDFPGMY